MNIVSQKKTIFKELGKQFYPTTKELIDKMLSNVDFSKVNSFLEPSAGKGDIIDVVNDRTKTRKNYNGHYTDFVLIDCCEIDTNLQKILRDKANILGSDFLETTILNKYDLIVMNPPFKEGDKHLLKAINLLSNKGYLACIINAETILNPYTYERKKLNEILQKKKAKIEIIENAFKNAENKTNVTVALVTVQNDEEDTENSFILNGLKQEKDILEKIRKKQKNYQIAINDIFKTLVLEYEMQVKAGIKLIEEYERIENMFPKLSAFKPMINLVIDDSIFKNEDKDNYLDRKSLLIINLRKKYWSLLFEREEMTKHLTFSMLEKLRDEINTKFIFTEFNINNIMQLNINLMQTMEKNIEKLIINIFDKLTYENSMDKEGNIHYIDGWKTNKCFYIQNKAILWAGCYEKKWNDWKFYKSDMLLDSIEKALSFLNGNKPIDKRVTEITRKIKETYYNGEWIECEFFKIQFKKKGTVHIKFTNMDLIKRFNIYAGKKKLWLPTTYGEKSYNELNKIEKMIVDDFEGKESYNNTYIKKLGTTQNTYLKIV